MLGYPTRPGLRRRAAIRLFLRRHKILIGFVILAILASAAVGSSWGYGKFKGRQSRHLTTLASEYVAKNQGDEARMCLETALDLQPNNAAALRLLARIQAAQKAGASALLTLQKLAATGPLTLEDLHFYASTAVREGDWATAERLANAIATSGNPTMSHLLKAELLVSKKDFAQAEAELRLAVEGDKTDRSKASLAHFLLTCKNTPATAPEILALLRELSSRPNALGAESLGTALSSGLVPPGEIPAWISAIRAHPSANSRLLLFADTLEIKTNPSAKAALIEKATTRLKTAPPLDRAAGMQWLLRMGAPAKALSLLTRDEAIQKRETLEVWMEANSLLNRWDVILDALTQPALPLPDYMQKLYKGRALIASGQTAAGHAAYAEAYQQTSDNPDAFLTTLTYLGVAGEDGLFHQGLQKNLTDPASAVATMRAVVPAMKARHDAQAVRRIYEMAVASPVFTDNLTVQNDLAYFNLLLGLPVDSQQIALRSQANPRDFAFRVTYALALLKAGQKPQALAELEKCEPDIPIEALAPYQKVVVVAALVANGRRKEALSVASLLSPQDLFAQEVDFLKPFLAQISSTPTPSPSPAPKPAPQKKKKK
jgi:tetratricopeptide (TPR) repeat protein